MYCNICGKEVADGVKFCTGCGNPLTQETARSYPRKDVRMNTGGRERRAYGMHSASNIRIITVILTMIVILSASYSGIKTNISWGNLENDFRKEYGVNASLPKLAGSSPLLSTASLAKTLRQSAKLLDIALRENDEFLLDDSMNLYTAQYAISMMRSASFWLNAYRIFFFIAVFLLLFAIVRLLQNRRSAGIGLIANALLLLLEIICIISGYLLNSQFSRIYGSALSDLSKMGFMIIFSPSPVTWLSLPLTIANGIFFMIGSYKAEGR